MADISLEQIVLQNKFLKELDLFCIFKFIVTNDLKIYNDESYNKLLKIVNSYKRVTLKSKNSFSNNQKINEFFFYNKEKWGPLKAEKNMHLIDGKTKAKLTKKKRYKNDLYCNDSLFAKSLNNKKLFELFNFPEEEEVCNYIRSICDDFVIDEPLRLNVSFKKYDKKTSVKSEEEEPVHYKADMSEDHFSANKDISENTNDTVHRESINSVFTAFSALSPTGNEIAYGDNKGTLANGNNWTNNLKQSKDEWVDRFIHRDSAEASIDLKQFILASREVNCCSSAMHDDSETHIQTRTNSIGGTDDKYLYINEDSSTEKTASFDKSKPAQEGSYLKDKTISNKLMLLEKRGSLNTISSTCTNETYHFECVSRGESINGNDKKCSTFYSDHIISNSNNKNKEDSSQDTNTEASSKCQEFVYKRKRSSNELSIYSYSTISNENNLLTDKFYDDTALCLNHFRDIYNFLNRDPSGLRKIKTMLKNEIATISISPFYINFDGVRIFNNVCKAFHLDKNDYKRKRLYCVLKLCMNNENAMSSLKNIFLEDLYEQQINYKRELCEKKFGKKKDHRKKHYRKTSALRKKQKSEEQLFEILNEEKRINVMYFMNRFLYSQKTPLSNLFRNYSLQKINEQHRKEEDTDIDVQYAFDEQTIDYFIFLMIFENKIEENFYQYLMKKIEQCKRESFNVLQETYNQKQKFKEKECKETLIPEDTCFDPETNNRMTDELLLLNYIKPFPTIFWLINKNICAYISHLEKVNIIKNIEKFIKNKNSKFKLLRRYLIYDHLKYVIIRTRHINRRILLFFYNNFVNSGSFTNETKFDDDIITKPESYLKKQETMQHMKYNFSKKWKQVLHGTETEKTEAEEEKEEQDDNDDEEEGAEEAKKEKQETMKMDIDHEEKEVSDQKKITEPVENNVKKIEQCESAFKSDHIPEGCLTSCATHYTDIKKSYNNSISVKLMPSEFCNVYNIDTGLALKILKKINTLRINGVGGISNFLNLKCIHLCFASHLSYPNTVGYILEECFKT